jgi:hypothetical protein
MYFSRCTWHAPPTGVAQPGWVHARPGPPIRFDDPYGTCWLRQASSRNHAAVNGRRSELRRATSSDSTRMACSPESARSSRSTSGRRSRTACVRSPGRRLLLAVRMQRSDARRFDPSRYGITDDDLDFIANTLERLEFRDPSIVRKRRTGPTDDGDRHCRHVRNCGDPRPAAETSRPPPTRGSVNGC